jgi:hypothetical protein
MAWNSQHGRSAGLLIAEENQHQQKVKEKLNYRNEKSNSSPIPTRFRHSDNGC